MANDPRFEVFPQAQSFGEKEELRPRQYHWRFRDANGRITFIGGEGFTRREDAHRAVHGAVEDVLTFVPTPEPILRLMRESVAIVDVEE